MTKRTYGAAAMLRCGVALAALTLSGTAFAQASGTTSAPAPAAVAGDDTDATPSDNKDIIVTGTLLRNTQVTGSQTITLDSKSILAKGAVSTNELLALIPQLGNVPGGAGSGRFEGDPRGFTAGQTSISKPNLRAFPSSNGTSGALTLVLVDGMRIAPVGINASSVDPDIVPAAVIAGIDVVTDGGSSLYGADAVGGVLNFRTMKKFDGIKLDGNYGFGTKIKGFHEWDAAITVGQSWSSGNAYISGGHSERAGVLNGEAPWSSGTVYSATGVPSVTSTVCNTPQQTVDRFVWFQPPGVWTDNAAAPGAGPKALGTGCDQVAATTYSPQQKRSNVYAALTNEFSDAISLRMTGYWTKRETWFINYPRGYTSVGATPVKPVTPGTFNGQTFDFPQGVGFTFAPNAAYVNTPSRIGFQTWGITPELTIKLGSNWQLRATGHYGRSSNFQRFPAVDATLAQCYITGCTGIAAGQLNPLNVAAANAAVITDITNFETAQDTRHQLAMGRAIADGSLFALPGGDAKLAVGLEYQNNKDETRLTLGKIGTLDALPYKSATRNSKSAYAELSLPLFSFLDLSGSVRYDHYSDFGSTTNPSVGLSLKPTSWFKAYGHWNTSYNAPTPIDTLGIGLGRLACGVYTVNGTPGTSQRPQVASGKSDNGAGTCALILTGGSPKGLKPQTAKSWALGFEIAPAGSGVRLGGEFYAINLKNALGSLNPSIQSTYQTNADLYIYNNEFPNQAAYNALLAQLSNGTAIGGQQPLTAIALVVDTRTSNLNAAKVEGVDFHANYDTDTGIGHLAMGINATLQTRARITGGGVTTNELGHGASRFSAVSFLGWNLGRMSARVTVNYAGDFHDIATDYLGKVERVAPFVVTNLNLAYNFNDSDGVLSGTSLRLTVDNLFEEDPQTIKRTNTNNPSYNNWTIGRVIKFGVSKKF